MTNEEITQIRIEILTDIYDALVEAGRQAAWGKDSVPESSRPILNVAVAIGERIRRLGGEVASLHGDSQS